MTGNLPPGVSDSDIPGNRPGDIAEQRFHEEQIEPEIKEFIEHFSDVLASEGSEVIRDPWIAWAGVIEMVVNHLDTGKWDRGVILAKLAQTFLTREEQAELVGWVW